MNFYLPSFFNKYKLNIKIIELLNEHPEYFYEDIKIGAIYGTFPGAIWNGGREVLGSTTLNNIKNTIGTFNSLNIPLRFTFTNNMLAENHLFDTYCNTIMSIGHNGMNGVIINSPLLEQYLRELYPNYSYILSTTRCERNINKINNFTSQYDMVVTDYRDNSNQTFLESITDKDKIELLINAYCNPNCQLRQKHYQLLSLGQLTFELINDDENINQCDAYNKSFYDILSYDSVIKVDDLYNKYTKMGFNNFKIEGRMNNNLDVIESYIYYLVVPEYQNTVRLMLLKAVL